MPKASPYYGLPLQQCPSLFKCVTNKSNMAFPPKLSDDAYILAQESKEFLTYSASTCSTNHWNLLLHFWQ